MEANEVQYGDQTIQYHFLRKEGLKAHYIMVDPTKGVILKGASLSRDQAERIILKKAKWILKKMALMNSVVKVDQIRTDSKVQYLGKQYKVQLQINSTSKKIKIVLNRDEINIFCSIDLNNSFN